MSADKNTFVFGDFVLDREERILRRKGEAVPLPPKAMQLLLVLLENRGRILEKDELMQRVWADTFVEEGNLPFTIRLLRKTLSDDANKPTFIETVPRRGYRFIGKNGFEPDSTTSNDVDADPLVGREKEISELTQLLGRKDVRLVTLTGTGGTGKTRLAREIARRLPGAFNEDVQFVELATLADPNLVATTVIQSLGIRDVQRSEALDALAEHFRGRESLLILDNFEQIVTAGVQLAALLQKAPKLKLIVTSREPLKVRPEIEYRVPPLGLPQRDKKLNAEELARSEAVQLFLRRAHEARTGFKPSDSDVKAVASICRALDGLPLALELAASRAKILSVDEILLKLENRLAVLTGGSRDMPQRQQTIRSTIEWSYGLLTDEEKLVFASLAVFEGSFTFAAAEKVISDASTDLDTNILDSITSLTEKGLLQSDTTEDGTLRFRMLVVVKDFALELLASSGIEQSLRKAHAEYFLELAEKAEPRIFIAQWSGWYHLLDLELDNLRAASSWSLKDAPERSARIALALQRYWTTHGHLREAQHWFEQILAHGDSLPLDLRSETMIVLGVMLQLRGDFKSSLKAYEQSGELSRELGDKKLIARSMRGVAAIEYMVGDVDAAIARLNEALQITLAIDDEFGSAAAYARLADIALADNDLDGARRLGHKALSTFRTLGYNFGTAAKLYTIGMAEFLQGDLKNATVRLREALETSISIGDRQVIHAAFDSFAALYLEAGDAWNAALLAGFASETCLSIDYVLEPAEARFRERYLERLKARMHEDDFNVAFFEGQALTMSQATELALRFAGKTRASRSGLRLVTK